MGDPATCDRHLKWGPSSGTEPSTCGVSTPFADLMSEVNWLVGRPVGVGRDTTYLLSGTKPGRTLLYNLWLGWGLGTGDYCMWVGNCTQKSLLVICFSEFLAESGTLLNGLWYDSILSWSNHPHAMCPGASLLQFPYLNRGTMLHELFERITNHECKDSPHVMVSDVHFPPKYLSWKDLSACISSPPSQKETYVK